MVSFHAYSTPGTHATLTTGSRSNLVFDADRVSGHVRVTLSQTVTGGTYQVLNYAGEVVDSGSCTGTTLDIDDNALTQENGKGPYGWYRVLIRGTNRSDGQYDDAYGDCSFLRVADAPDGFFRANPAPGATAGVDDTDEIARAVMGVGPARYQIDVKKLTVNVDTANTATGTSVDLTISNAIGLLTIAVHVFQGDGSSITTPTNWQLIKRTNNGNTWVSVYGRVLGSTPVVQTFSSGAHSGNHRAYGLVVNGYLGFGVNINWSTAVSVAESVTGTGTTGTVNLDSPGWALGEEMVVGVAATATGVTFSTWNNGMADPRSTGGVSSIQPATAGSQELSVASVILPADTGAVDVTATWDTSAAYVVVAFAIHGGEPYKATVNTSAAALETGWVDYADGVRGRRIIGSFADGTAGYTDAVTAVLDDLSLGAWEAFNEPNLHAGYQLIGETDEFIAEELAPFYTTVKAADPDAWVIGPSPVAINWNGLAWLEQFLIADGADYLDALAIHPYNSCNGDPWLTRVCYQGVRDLLTTAGVPGFPMFQTEQGFRFHDRGVYHPRHQGRFAALLLFMQELFGLPVEHNHYWYDERGFDEFPMWWVSPSGPGPVGGILRTMSRELRSTTFDSELDFGAMQDAYAAGVWTRTDGSSTVGVVGGSAGLRDVRLAVTGVAHLTVVDAWGNETVHGTEAGYVRVPVSELPTWLRVPKGASVELGDDWTFGTNHALAATPATTGSSTNLARVSDGVQRNPYYKDSASLAHADAPYSDTSGSFPQTITLTLSGTHNINRAVVYAFPPWQSFGAPTHFTLDVSTDGSSWSTVHTFDVTDDLRTVDFTSKDARCVVETYWAEQWIWDIDFATVAAQKVRLVVHDVSVGGYADSTVNAATTNGNNGVKNLTVRDFAVFDAPPPDLPSAQPPKAVVLVGARR